MIPAGRWLLRSRWRPGRRFALTILLLLAVLGVVRLLPHRRLDTHLAFSSAVASTDGTLLRLTLAADGQYRLWTPMAEISPTLVEATLLYEDRHFYRHFGVNPIALGRAATATYLRGPRRIGGSTITMQLARRLWSLSSHTFGGKLVQIARALQLEAQYSKREILEAYLNVAPYGGNIEGIGAASQIYFRKPARRLALAESLTLAVIPQSPSHRAPLASLRAAQALDRARSTLLAAWTARGAAEPLVHAWPRTHATDDLPFHAPHFVDDLLSATITPDTPATSTDGKETVGSGLTRTTLDLRLQHLIERHLSAYVARTRRRGIENAAALLVDVRTTAVRALVGSANFFDPRIAGQVNGTRAPRSPGSTLKPFAYGLAMDQGIIHPATLLRDVPTAFASYSPENFDGRFAGPLSAQEALIRSRNVPALTIAGRLGRPGLYDFLKTAGVDLPQPESHYGLGLVLGTGEVTMQDLVRLYAALATGGVMHPLVWLARDERTRLTKTASNAHAADLASRPSSGVRLLSEESSYLVLDMLADNPRPIGRAGAGQESRPLPVAWKTGTSWGFRDAWAVGLFGPYVLAVWAGDFSGAGNPALVGAEAAAPLFFEIVDSIAAHQPDVRAVSFVRAFPPPIGIRRVDVCALSGGLPNAHCPHRRATWFIPARSPIEPCTIHRLVAIDGQDRRTCAAGPAPVRTALFEVWPSDLTKLFAAAGLPRRPLPPAAPGCAEAEGTHGDAPRITSPLAGVTYKLRPPVRGEGHTVALQAVTGGDAGALFWFADQVFIGRSDGASTLFWNPKRAGQYIVRAVDDLGRGDARPVAIEVMP